MNMCGNCRENGRMTNCKDKQALMNDLRAEDFVVYEAALYLNVYPYDKEALEYFKCHKETAARLRKEYEAMYGPLTINEVNGDSWTWTDCPWPWEKEAN